MEMRPKRLLMIAAIIVGLTLYWGCTQQDEILSDKTQTGLELSFERMPTNPSGLVYGLGVARELTTSSGGADSVSGAEIFATFGFDWDQRVITDPDGSPRADSNHFLLEKDLYDYGYLFVSVQRADGGGPEIGPIMLIDEVSDPFVDPIDLIFPWSDSLYQSFAYYHMMAVSDDTAQGDISDGAFETNGAAVWFNSVLYTGGQLQDTFALDSFSIDTNWVTEYLNDTCRTFIVGISNIRDTVVKRGFGLDTFDQMAVRYDVEIETWCVDTLEIDTTVHQLLTTSLTYWWDLGPMNGFNYFDHVQIGGDFKDVTGYGWHYEGWVLTSLLNGASSLGELNPPAWVSYNTDFDSLIYGVDGRMISTGQFATLAGPDMSNPYTIPDKVVPPYPGEDFLTNLPAGVGAPLQLVPRNEPWIHGSILITLEPTNRVDGSSNFPLIVNVGPLPADSSVVLSPTQAPPGYWLQNMTNTNTGAGGSVLQGFPKVKVDINRM